MNCPRSLCPFSSFRGNYVYLPRKRWRRRDRQTGTALVMALVILMILTILGISSMNTSIMEERMSGNIQDLNRAFEAAESGISRALNTIGSLDPGAPVTTPFDFGTGATATKASVTSVYVGTSKGKPGYELDDEFAHFDLVSTGQTSIQATGAQAELHQGIFQYMPSTMQ